MALNFWVGKGSKNKCFRHLYAIDRFAYLMTVKANSNIISGLQDIASWGLASITVATSASCLVTVTPNGHRGVSENFLNGDLPTRARNCAKAKITTKTVQASLRGVEQVWAITGSRPAIYFLRIGDYRNLFSLNAVIQKTAFSTPRSENFPNVLRSAVIAVSILAPPCIGEKTHASAGIHRPALNLFHEEMP